MSKVRKNGIFRVACQWLDEIANSRNITIQHAMNIGEKMINHGDKRIKFDGYCAETNTVFEFHGCYWHGCLSATMRISLMIRMVKK